MNNEQGSNEPQPLTYAEIKMIYRRLGTLSESFGYRPNPRDRAEVMIGACITEGVNTRFEIVKMLGAIGLSKDLVRKALEERTGLLWGDHLWQCDARGLYSLLHEADAVQIAHI